jgi:hypothetical protein
MSYRLQLLTILFATLILFLIFLAVPGCNEDAPSTSPVQHGRGK